ncbi:hypothetical protein BMAPRL20_A3550 [Burkholderia mallei PRL-20]|uniref:Uncharacterized protein n=2 Tax=pseudomallei group TaxID=111527 RepID=A2S7W9_BURM9|nr:hypothetical protein BMA10229_A2074 [Burkholderia mallei NCTC 10229]ABN91861.1 hypothetical protein BURPS1106A_0307 [Burkholderia pseudomallei 1106a]ACQ98438.1 conserved hypothetical protein [Burkholderia pseudomallei MSHR346]EDP85769.1 hypothetical protein BMA10399_D1012 [Burkholderia mallei ATCC 10399]EES26546.1 hypothetical protein BURPS1106B_A3589 [Burkholderia pseudomallei 1106b]EES44692.1 hypothetical protein BMAPRL20_A3550 [Burkholderia mallei PRL-20]
MPRAGKTPECLTGIAHRTRLSSSCKTNPSEREATRTRHD